MRAAQAAIIAARRREPRCLQTRSVGIMSAKANGRSGQRVQQAASHLRRDVEELADAAGEQLEALHETARNQAAGWEQPLEDRIRQQPIQAVLIAAGVGIVVGLLLRR
jgi:ElaB/YqjD/DUF883 family membrane-anchored ribosome-binding protein